jgi:hypothetical protein
MRGALMARVLRVLLLVMLVACDEEEDDFCDPAKHHISLHPLDDIDYVWAVAPTAVGGTQRVSAYSYTDCGDRLDPSQVSVQAVMPAVISATVVGTEELVLEAHAAGEAQLVVSNEAGLMATRLLEARPVASVTASNAQKGDPQLYYSRGNLTIHVNDDNGSALVDERLTVVGDIARAAAWNQLDLATATPGDHMLGIVVGTSTWDLTVHVVGSIDAVVPEVAAFTASTDIAVDVCFFAELGGQTVGNVPWQFSVDRGKQYDSYIPDCVQVSSDQAQAVTVTATALGHTGIATVTFKP